LSCKSKDDDEDDDNEEVTSLERLQGEWLSECQDKDGGGKQKLNIKIEDETISYRFYDYGDGAVDCDGSYDLFVPGDVGEWLEGSTLTINEVGAPEEFVTYNDSIIGDEEDVDYIINYFESDTVIYSWALGTGGTSPGETWEEWLEYSNSGRDVSDFVADPTGYADSTKLTKVE
jgi:hypothetical protein